MVLDKDDADAMKKLANLKKAIRGDYRHNWIIDNLPAASLMENEVRAVDIFWSYTWLYVYVFPGGLSRGVAVETLVPGIVW